MKIIIPMAGTGNRFVQKGYKEPKPLIEINGKKIIEYILQLFNEEDEIVFICNDQHIKNTNMKTILNRLKPNSRIVEIPEHKFGPVYTVFSSYNFIDDDEEVLVCYCDNPFLWDYENFKKYKNKYDGVILTHTGMHPHTLNSTKMAFLKIENDLVTEIKEKECFTNDPLQEHASTGAYYFKNGKILKKYFNELMNKNINYNGEFYVTLVYNLLIRDGLKISFYDTEFVTVFGTPEELESFKAWNTILTSGQVKSEKDLLECFRYWKKYYEKNNFC